MPEQGGLHAAGLRSTRQREAVLEILREREDAVTAQDLYLELRAAGLAIGLATVYRTLTLLAEAGLVDTFQRGGEQAFRACSPRHHHHLVCTRCHSVTELEPDLVEEWVQKVAGAHDFTVSSHSADIFGTCGSCSNASQNDVP